MPVNEARYLPLTRLVTKQRSLTPMVGAGFARPQQCLNCDFLMMDVMNMIKEIKKSSKSHKSSENQSSDNINNGII
jgi:hypothetical protein